MRKLIFALSLIAATGLALPLSNPANAERAMVRNDHGGDLGWARYRQNRMMHNRGTIYDLQREIRRNTFTHD